MKKSHHKFFAWVLLAIAIVSRAVAQPAAESSPPVLTGHWPEYRRANYSSMAIAGSHIYAFTRAGLQVFDFTDPAHLRRVTNTISLNQLSPIIDLAPSGQRVLALRSLEPSTPSSTLQVFDIQEPNQPILAGTLPLGFVSGRLVVRGNHGFVTSGENSTNQLYVFDLTNPIQSRRVSTLGLTERMEVIAAADGLVFLHTEKSMMIVNVSDITVPRVAGLYKIQSVASIYHVVAEGTLAYIYLSTGELIILDVSNPSEPVERGRFTIPVGAMQLDRYGLALSGDYAYLGATIEQRAGQAAEQGQYFAILVLDVSDKDHPVEVARIPAVEVRGLRVVGNRLLATGAHGFRVFDISEPRRPFSIVAHREGSGGGLELAGQHLYLADGYAGLDILNVSIPERPRLISRNPVSDFVEDVVLAGSRAYLAARSVIQVLDVSNPVSPSVVKELPATWANQIALSGNYLFISDFFEGLHVLDISDPANPIRVASKKLSGKPTGIVISEGRACLAAGADGWLILDVSNPLNPVELARHTGYVSGVGLRGNVAFVAQYWLGFSTFDIRNTLSPIKLDHHPAASDGVSVIGDRAYVAMYGGVGVLDVTDPARLRFDHWLGRPESETYRLQNYVFARDVAVSGSTTFISNRAQSLEVFGPSRFTFGFSQKRYEALRTAGTISIPVVRTGDIEAPGSVDFTILQGGQRTLGLDFPLPGPLHFAPGESRKDLVFRFMNPVLDAGTVEFDIQLVGAEGGAIGELSVARVSLMDRGFYFSGAGNLSEYLTNAWFGISLSISNTNQPVTVDYSVTAGVKQPSATPGADFTPVSGTLSFAAGEQHKFFNLRILEDSLVEGREWLRLTLSNPTKGVPIEGDGQFDIELLDTERGFYIVGNVPTNYEGAGELQIFIRRDGTNQPAATVNYAVTSGVRQPAATSGMDFTPIAGTLSFAAGELSKTIAVPLLNDSLVEGQEWLRLTLSNPTGGTPIDGDGQIDVILRDDDHGFYFAGTGNNSEGAGELQIYIRREGVNPPAATVNYAVTSGVRQPAATSGEDFIPIEGTLSFAAGELSKTITVLLLDDALVEGQEWLRLTLSDPTGGTPIEGLGFADIGLHDDGDRGFYVAGTGNNNEAAGELQIYIRREGVNPPAATVNYAVTAGVNQPSATPGQDFTPVAGTLSFAAGELSKTITVPLLDDALIEGLEWLQLTLSNPTGGTGVDGPGWIEVQIQDDDRPPYFVTPVVSLGENSGEAVLTVRRAGSLSDPATVSYRSVAGTALAGQDFTPVSGRVTFQVGEATAQIHIPIQDDPGFEPQEQFRVVLYEKSEVQGPLVQWAMCCQDDLMIPPDLKQTCLIDPSTCPVLNWNGHTYWAYSHWDNRVGMTIVAYNPAGEIVRQWERLGARYIWSITTDPVAKTVNFWGQANQTFTMSWAELALPPITEGFDDEPGQLSITSSALVNIHDDDRGFYFAGTGNNSEAAGELQIHIRREGGNSPAATVNYAITAGVNQPSATPGQDFTPVAGTLNFAAGENQKSLAVPLLNDSLVEGREWLRLTLSNPTGGTPIDGLGLADIELYDDDRGFYVAGSSNNSEAAGELLVYIRREGGNSPAATVNYAITAGVNQPAATPGADFTPVSGTLNFAAGELFKTIAVPILNDALTEDPEHLLLTLTTGVGTPVEGDGRSHFVIYDNEFGYTVGGLLESADDGNERRVREREGEVRIVIHRLGDFDFASTVKYRIEGIDPGGSFASATPGADFEAASGELTFAAGQTSIELPVRLHADAVLEDDEQFRVLLSEPSAGVRLSVPEGYFTLVERHRYPVRLDPDFQPEIVADAPIYNWAPNAVSLPAGRVLLASDLRRFTGEHGARIFRLLPDGSRDLAFAPADLPGYDTIMLPLADGGALVSVVLGQSGPGEFLVNGERARVLARLLPDGTRSVGWQVPAAVAFDRVTALTQTADNRLAVAGVSESGGHQVFWLNADGSLAHPGPVKFNYDVFQLLPQPDGGVLARGWFDQVNDRPQRALARLRPDGTPDPNFVSLREETSILGLTQSPDGAVVWTRQYDEQFGTEVDIIQRLRPTGEADPAFKPYRVVHPQQIRHIAADSRAIWILRTREGQVNRLDRLGLDGTVDPQLPPSGLELGLIEGFKGMDVRAADFMPMPEGGLLLRRVFGVNGHRRLGLAKLDVTAPLARVEVAPRSARVAENAGTVAVHLVRTGDPTAAWPLRWSTEDGTARAGVDYQAASGEVTFHAGGSEAAITLTLLDNAALDEDRSLRLRFTTIPEGAALPLVEVTLVNEDLGFVPGTFRAFPNGTWTVRPTGHLDGGRPTDTSVILEMMSDLGIVETEQWLSPFTDWDVTRNEGEYPNRYLRLRRD